MKKLSIFALALVIGAACTKNSDSTETTGAEEVATMEGQQFAVNLDSSAVDWKAFHKGGFAPRWGTIKLSQGELSVSDGSITAGSFTIDMSTIFVDEASVTEKDKKASDLQDHLKSADFFDVTKYPTAKFEITSVSDFDAATQTSVIEGVNKTVSGNLTLKDSTLNVTFPAKVLIENGKLNVDAKFTVDRSAWGIKFGTTEADPAEWGISKDFEVGVHLTGAAK